jgi:hypothetical protein
VQVVLTASGRSAVDDAMSDLLAREHVLLSSVDEGDRQVLADLLRGLVQQFGD